MQRQDLARTLGSLEGRVATHQRHPARVTTEVDGCEIGVGRNNRDIERIDAEYLGDDIGKD